MKRIESRGNWKKRYKGRIFKRLTNVAPSRRVATFRNLHNPCRRRLGTSTKMLLLFLLAGRSYGFGNGMFHRGGMSPLLPHYFDRCHIGLNARSPSDATQSKGADGDAVTKRSSSKRVIVPRTVTKRSEEQITETEPIHWVLESDEVALNWYAGNMDAASSSTLATVAAVPDNYIPQQVFPSYALFTIRGNPLPLRRHRTSRGFTYNPSAAAQKSFREAVENTLSRTTASGEKNPRSAHTPLWDSHHTLAVSIIFRMKRPKIHFVGGKPGPGRLRPTAPKQSCSNMRTDVDNLAKFVLDSLTGVIYEDDRQIASLHATKIYDNDTDELCRGSTLVCIRLLLEDDLPRLLSNSVDIYGTHVAV